MESPYYSKEFGPIVCTVCAQQLGINTRLERFREDSKHFAQVLPTCSDDCGKWKTSYPRNKGTSSSGRSIDFIPKVCSNIIWFHSWLMLTLDRQSCQRLKSKPISPMRSLHLTMSTARSRCKARSSGLKIVTRLIKIEWLIWFHNRFNTMITLHRESMHFYICPWHYFGLGGLFYSPWIIPL